MQGEDGEGEVKGVPSKGFLRLGDRLVDRLLPPQAEDFSLDELRKARLLVAFGLFLTAFVGLVVIGTLLVEAKRSDKFALITSIRLASAFSIILNLLWFSRHGKTLRAARIFLLITTLPLLPVTFAMGGARSIAIFLVVVPPLLCTFFLGLRWGVAAIGFVFLYLFVLQLPAVLAVTPPPRLLLLPTHRAFFCGMIAVLVLGVLWLFESNRLRAVRALEESFHNNLELAIARDRALQASAAKSEFLATMSHELRTPLNAIIGYTEMLTEDAEEEGQEGNVRDLSRITQAGQHLLALINDVLDLSKIEEGHIDLAYEPTPLDDFLTSLDKDVRGLVEKKGNTFSLTHQTESKLCIDPRRLRQVLLNLISNAAKFTEEGSISLTITEHKDAEGAVWFQFVVTDTGIGMSSDVLGRVFQRFTQGDATSTRKYGGTGLGLAITKELCEMMGGSVQAVSAIGKGSTFTILFPAKPLPGVYEAAMAPSDELLRVTGEIKLPTST